MSVSFLHIADLHLDSPFKSISKVSQSLSKQMKQANKQSFERLITFAIEKSVDFIIIAGDSFNSEKPNVSAQLFFKQQLERAIQANIQVILCFGNHDYSHHSLLVTLPSQVMIFPEHVATYYMTTKSNERVAISGFSYYTNHVNERMLVHYPPKEPVDFHIGVLHGEVLGDTSSVGDYAPFSLQELNSKHYDYWALGHIHKRQLLQNQPPIAYSGSIQGLNRKELDEKGGFLVTLQSNQFATVTPINTSSIIWLQKDMTITQQTTIEQVVLQCESFYTTLKKDNVYLLSIVWHIESGVSKEIVDTLMSDDFKQVLSIGHVSVVKQMLQLSQYGETVTLNTHMQTIWNELKQNGIHDDIYNDIMSDVFGHKYMTLLSEFKHDKSLKDDIMQLALTRIQQNLEEIHYEN